MNMLKIQLVAFTETIKNQTLRPEMEYISYDIKSSFTDIQVSKTEKIYGHKSIKLACKSKLIFRLLLVNLTQNCMFTVNGAVSDSRSHMNRMEEKNVSF